MIATGFVADSTSLPLIISQLVNIVSTDYFGITFDRYAALMVPVDLAALAPTLLILRGYYGRDIEVSYPVADLKPPSSASTTMPSSARRSRHSLSCLWPTLP